MPSKMELLKAYRKLTRTGKLNPDKKIENLLRTRKVRSLSGITAITVITSPRPQWSSGKPISCPWNCLYCPDEKNMPKSYLANEPACMRAELTNFDPYKQTEARLNSLKAAGHATDKIELIVLGGSWTVYPKQYQSWFIKRCFDACNQSSSPTLRQAQKKNEIAKNRIIGITLETRPDYITSKEIKRMRNLGCTRVELGVQTIYNNILNYNRRGHGIKETITATRLLKNAGIKVTYHIMLNLPKSNLKKDEKIFDELFSNPDFQPDQLKIYPCVILKTAPLYKIWKQKKYKPYTENQLINLLIRIKKKIPPYVRIIRVIRDIPSPSIVAGNKVSNLRQIIKQKTGDICRCIRCREIKSGKVKVGNIKLERREYQASEGKEIFLSFEDIKQDKLLAFLRLRITNQWTIPTLNNSAIIRELHTYGHVAKLSKKSNLKFVQHKGLGKKLMNIAEKIVKTETKFKKISVISGIGVREYYRKLGYRQNGEYMVKLINKQ